MIDEEKYIYVLLLLLYLLTCGRWASTSWVTLSAYCIVGIFPVGSKDLPISPRFWSTVFDRDVSSVLFKLVNHALRFGNSSRICTFLIVKLRGHQIQLVVS